MSAPNPSPSHQRSPNLGHSATVRSTDPAANHPATASAAVAIGERPARTVPGLVGVILILALLAVSTWLFVIALDLDPENPEPLPLMAAIVVLVLAALMLTGLDVVQPGTTKVVVFFGSYLGTVRQPGFWLVLPLSNRKRVSVRVHNFETNELKVNDADGTPVNVAAIVVWRVADTGKASFEVENYEEFIAVQSEAALRHVVMSHPYDGPDDEVTLRGSTDGVSAALAGEVANRVEAAGLEIIEVRISKLAYAPEIAEAMLRRQQAGAIIAARERIVEGAVSVVHAALQQLEGDGTVHLDDERRAAMVSNLLVVLTSDQQVNPVINTGSLYT